MCVYMRDNNDTFMKVKKVRKCCLLQRSSTAKKSHAYMINNNV